jgi:hypothetical protein
MEGRTAIKRRKSFDKTNRICELETAKAFFRQLQATLAEKRSVNVAPSGTSIRRSRNRQRLEAILTTVAPPLGWR